MKRIITVLLLVSTVLILSCEDDFLGKKPSKSLVVPSTLEDFQAILDNADEVMNVVPGIGMISSDDAFTSLQVWQALFTATERNAYTWSKDVFEGEVNADWETPYRQIFYANIVLDGLNEVKVNSANEQQWQQIKGSALFFRAHAFFQLAGLFADPYDPNVSSTPGIPIRLTSDVNAPVVRASLSETYRQIIDDLQEAEALLPTQSNYKTRPTREAAYALLARTYLLMGDYGHVDEFASKALEQNDFLIDYNTLDVNLARPIPRMNNEIIFYAAVISYGYTFQSTTYVDTLLYSQYATDDLRTRIFFRPRASNRYSFKGTYTSTAILFGGIARDEVYLMRAEARARLNNGVGALQDLNRLLSSRWKTGKYVPATQQNQTALLDIILKERRKELVCRNTRWSDLRRLNKEGIYNATLQRTIAGVSYSLPPNDARYTFPIPIQEINTSGIAQNPR